MSTKTHLFQIAELVAGYHPSLQVRKTYLYQLDDLRTAIAHHDCNRTDNLFHLTDNWTDIRNHLSPKPSQIMVQATQFRIQLKVKRKVEPLHERLIGKLKIVN